MESDDFVEIDLGEFESDEEEIEQSEDDTGIGSVQPDPQNIPLSNATSTDKSVADHVLSLDSSTDDEQLNYLKKLRQIPHYFQAHQQKQVIDPPLVCFKKFILPIDSPKCYRQLKLEAPVQETLLRIFNFMPDIDSRNQVVAWLMHPRNSQQLHHLLQTTFSSKKLWRHAIINSRKKIFEHINIPVGRSVEDAPLPVLNITDRRSYSAAEKHSCLPYHHPKLCKYRITGTKSAVKDILEKYDIPVEIPRAGKRKRTDLPDAVTQPNDQLS